MSAKYSPMSDVLRAAFPADTAKLVARESDTRLRTVEQWLVGRYTNSADAMLRIAFKNKRFRDVLIRHLEAAGDVQAATAEPPTTSPNRAA